METVCCCLTMVRQLLEHVGAKEIMRRTGNSLHTSETCVTAGESRRLERDCVWISNSAFFPSPFYFDLTFCACCVTLCFLCVTIFVFVVWVSLLCGFGATPSVWLCSIDPCIAVLCHGWHRGVALCRCGETSLPWFISFYLSLSLFLSFHFLLSEFFNPSHMYSFFNRVFLSL